MAEKLCPQHRVYVEIAFVLRHLDAAVIPAIVFGLFTHWFRSSGLLAGWALGMTLGTALSASVGFKPVFALPGFGGVYIGLIALAANIAVAALTTAIANARGLAHASDATQAADYEDAAAIS